MRGLGLGSKRKKKARPPVPPGAATTDFSKPSNSMYVPVLGF
jgi:hypothetical protein